MLCVGFLNNKIVSQFDSFKNNDLCQIDFIIDGKRMTVKKRLFLGKLN